MVKRVLLSTLLASFLALPAAAEQFVLPAGSPLHCRLTQAVSTKLNFQGDAFTATVTEPVVINGHQAVPYGSTVQGRIAWMQRPGRVKGAGAMQLAVDKITFPDGRSFPVAASLVTTYGAEGAKMNGTEGLVTGPTSRLKDLEEVGIGMGGGGFMGTMFGGFHGAVIGGAIGGAAALADTLRKRGPDLTLPTGTELNYQLTHELVIQ